ncbi:MAG: ribonuclease P protein component [Candidatus Brocadiia bacterium]
MTEHDVSRHFPRKARLLTPRDFQRVYKNGIKLIADPLYVRALHRPEMEHDAELPGHRSRLGLSIGRKVGPAHERNRWKRAVREAFRRNRHHLRGAYDLVIGINWNADPEEAENVEKAFCSIIDRLNQRTP